MKLDIGRVLSQTFRVTAKNFIPFMLMVGVLQAGPAALARYLTVIKSEDIYQRFPDVTTYAYFLMAFGIATGVVGLVLSRLFYGPIIRMSTDTLIGRRTGFVDLVKLSLGSFGPLLVLALVQNVALSIGLVLLIIPGLIAATVWSVAGPALVVEKLSFMDSMRRSEALTHTARLPILALIVISFASTFAINLLWRMIPFPTAFGIPWSIVAGASMKALQVVVWLTGSAVLYFELRGQKEGFGSETMFDVFD